MDGIASTCKQCATRVCHPHHGQPDCLDPECDCNEYLYCEPCGQMWPCEIKKQHVAERKANAKDRG